MGAGSSRVEAPPRRRKRLGLAGCLCGGASAAAAAAGGGGGHGEGLVASASSSGSNEVESRLSERVVMPEVIHTSVAAKDLQISAEPHLKVSSAHPSSSTISHHLRYNRFSYHENKENRMGTDNPETSGLERSSRKEVAASGNFNADVPNAEITSSERSISREPDIVEPLLEDVGNNMVGSTEFSDSITGSDFHASLIRSDGTMPLEAGEISGEISLNGNLSTTALSSERLDISRSSSISRFPTSTSTASSLNGESILDAIPTGPEVLTLRRSQDQSGGSILNDEMVSIFSNNAPGQSRETSSSAARRNNRRFLWDSLSRHNSGRYLDSNTDDLGFYSRWLDLGNDLFGDDIEESRYFHRRRHGSIRLSQNSRSRIRDHGSSIFDSSNEHASTACPLGIHQVGRCTCDSFLVAEESRTRASISRIVMLTEALFEVLDEIHRQPASLSLSMVSVQAPESVVNSLPCKSYTKLDTTQYSDDAEQCHICLTEYEDGDQIRILPCNHEFHVQCVDKWLKEVHRVCPLCRGDVCEGVS